MRFKCMVLWSVWGGIAATSISGCGGGDAGHQSNADPEARVVVLGNAFSSESDGVVSTKVRSGTEVLLSGKESDGIDAPILHFKWSGVDAAAQGVHLISRNRNTVAFTAPSVTTVTTLEFKLEVEDSQGGTDTARVRVIVDPIPDANHFLEYLDGTQRFAVVAGSAIQIPGDSLATADATVPFTVTMTKLVTYRDRGGIVRTDVSVGKPVSISSGWSAQLGNAGPSCDDPRNPQVTFIAPSINLDDPLQDGSGLHLGDVVEVSDIDEVELSAQLSITSPGALELNSGATPLLCPPVVPGTGAFASKRRNGRLEAPSQPTSQFVVRVEELPAPSGPRDTRASALAYYDTVAASGAKLTLVDWLSANGFQPLQDNYGADAHAIYLNNFDLGFGRDMYMKIGQCDAGANALPLQDRIGKCDVASVVINYSTVESAAKRLNPILAVAMEYSSGPYKAERFTKFFVYAPDRRTGQWKRVTSVNLDGRGEKFVPQACTVCHGGVPGTVTAGLYSNGGDVNAGFLLWDLDSFLYSDTEPSLLDASLKQKFTRSGQEAQLKLLNSGAYLTLADPNRFAAARELVEGWYGGPGLPHSKFDGGVTPSGWQASLGVDGISGTNDDVPSTAPTIYHNVFAQHCRACHVYHVPGNTPHQLSMSSYREFVDAPRLAQRLGQGVMPFARMTMDRLWESSRGNELLDHIRNARPDQAGTVIAPGTPHADIVIPNVSHDLQQPVVLMASNPSSVNSVTWQVFHCDGVTIADPGMCADAISVSGATLLQASVQPNRLGVYRVALTLNNSTAATDAYFEIKNRIPEFPAASTDYFSTLPVQLGTVGSISFLLSSLGNGTEAQHVMRLTPDAGMVLSPSACLATNGGCPANSVVSVSTVNTTETLDQRIAVSITDLDGSVVQGYIRVDFNPSIVAPPIVIDSTANGACDLNFFTGEVTPVTAELSCAAEPLPAALRNRTDLRIFVSRAADRGNATSRDENNGLSMGLRYTPPARFSTHPPVGTVGAGAPVSFGYQIEVIGNDGAVVEQSKEGQVSLRVRSRTSFDEMRAVWSDNSNNCASCHSSAPPNFATLSYQDIRKGRLTKDISIGYVDLMNIDKSGLLCWPLDEGCPVDYTPEGSGPEDHHTGGRVDPSVLLPVRQWLEDGANNF